MSGKITAIVITASVVVITSIILIAVSFGVVEPTEYGILVNGNTVTVDRVIRRGGRHFVGLGGYFIKFPNTVITEEFSKSTGQALEARSKDGLTVLLDTSFEYRLKEGELLQLYYKFNTDFKIAISKVAREAIRTTTSQFEAFAFFISRNNVSTSMYNEVKKALGEFHCDLSSFQLLNIQLPKKFDAAIQTTEVTRQSIEKAEFDRLKAKVEADTQVLAATQQSQIIKNKAAADAQSVILKATAEASAIQSRTDNLNQAYSNLRANYTMSVDDLLTWIWLTALQDTQATVSYNVQKPAEIKF